MIADALKFMQDLARKAADPKKLESDPRHLRYAINGAIEEIELPEPPRNHAVGCLEDLIRLASRFASDECEPVVWYSESAVVLVIDDVAHRIELATLALDQSDAWKTLIALRAEKPWFEQRPFIRLLRIDLVRTLEPAVLLERVRRVRFENGSTTTGEVQRTRESMGRTINSQVEAGGDLPEEVTLEVPVYKTQGERDRYPLRCAVEVDPARGMFQLIPAVDEIERIQHMALASIRDRLSELLPETVPHYYGRP